VQLEPEEQRAGSDWIARKVAEAERLNDSALDREGEIALSFLIRKVAITARSWGIWPIRCESPRLGRMFDSWGDVT
jgi:hypothetical protein